MIGSTNAKMPGSPVNSAYIHVKTTNGAMVTFSFGGVIVATLASNKGLVDNSNSLFAHYYYKVESANYGSWTVTATKSGYSGSSTITVDAAKQCDVELLVTHIITNGTRVSGFTWTATGCSISNNSGKYVLFTGGGNGYHLGFITINLSQYTQLRYLRPYTGESVRIYKTNVSSYNGTQTASGGGYGSWYYLDVSSLTGNYRVGGYTTSTNKCYIYEMYLV